MLPPPKSSTHKFLIKLYFYDSTRVVHNVLSLTHHGFMFGMHASEFFSACMALVIRFSSVAAVSVGMFALFKKAA